MVKIFSRFLSVIMLLFGVVIVSSCANEDDIDFNSDVVINGVNSYIKTGTAVARKGNQLTLKFAIIAEEKDGKKVFMGDNDAEDYDFYLPSSVKIEDLKEGEDMAALVDGIQLKFNPTGPFTPTKNYSFVSGKAKIEINNGRRLTIKYENYRFFTSKPDNFSREYINISGTVEYTVR